MTVRSRAARAGLATALCTWLAACGTARPATAPMRTLALTAPSAAADAAPGDRALIVLLPGRGDAPEDLVARGMVDMVRARGIAADVVVVDAHVGYYRSRQAVERLLADVIAPARARGYRSIWLAGISLGGFGALLYGARYGATDPIDGVFAIAPYLGRGDDLPAEIRAAGGLPAWDGAASADDDYARLVFAWLRGFGDPGEPRPQLWLGVGADDRFAERIRLVAPLLPADHFIEVPGGHTWQPWLRIWGTMLDQAPLPRVAVTATAVSAAR
ncbi:MAG: alpha/beta hydrolase [Planctomycetes bacterium]|nr:alpha/beta hydrolase [Planctomycetota bacterium]